ncbi:extracellular lipase [Xylariaceae sp. FL0255]|nr:extracellular lipase [Xylariaceae sp. FL0255]
MKSFSWSLISSFALLAAAQPLGKLNVNEVNERSVITTAQFNTFKYFAQHAGAAYCNSVNPVGSVITCSDDVCDTVHANGATILATFSGSATSLEGYVAQDSVEGYIVVSMRGSSDLDNFITDFEFIQESSSLVSGGLVHTGFQTAWNEVSSAVWSALASATKKYPSYDIVFTGHSLGAAVATLGAAYTRNQGYYVDVVNFGSPRFGNVALVEYITNDQDGAEWRMTHLDDPVPRLPPIIFGYAHTSPEYWLSDGTDTTDNYGVSDVVECTGFTNTNCNGGTLGLDIIAHLNYLEPISGCNSLKFILSKRQTEQNYVYYLATSPGQNMTTDQLTTQVNQWSQQDKSASS